MFKRFDKSLAFYILNYVFIISLVSFYSCKPDLPDEIEQAYADLPEVIDYNFHVKPIISDRCYACHGPDKEARKAGLRLDIEENAFATLESGVKAFAHGSISKSEAVARMLSHDSEKQMPPPDSKLTLDTKEIATIIKWIDQGAVWKPHWAFIPPVKSEVPDEFPSEWEPNNELDQFIYQKLVRENLTPSPKADKERLIRRVTMDLTGLPPTIGDIDQFLNDQSENAYEKVVDRLLSSDAYAERLAMEWMDVSRYADSHGLHADGYRYMWPWRDWVIKAFKENMGYNQFVTWQLAGDLLPNATQEQILATAFHRNNPMTAEGGVIDEEWRVEYVADRTNTTATAFMGLTMECARCHDHKFDPISQKEYYQLSAFFNNMAELGMTGDDGNFGPQLMMTDEEDEEKIAAVKQMLANKESTLSHLKERTEITASSLPKIAFDQDLVRYHPFEKGSKNEKGNHYLDGITQSRSRKEPVLMDGKVGKALKLTGEYDDISLDGVGIYEAYDDFSAGLWVNTTKRKKDNLQTLMGNTGQKNNFWRGWDFELTPTNQVSLRLIHSLPDNYIQVTTVDSVKLNTWTHVMFTYDGSMHASGVKLFINGKKAESVVEFDHLYKGIHPVRVGDHEPDKRGLRVGRSYRAHTGEFGLYQGLLDEMRIYDRELTPLEVLQISGVDEIPDQELIQQHYLATKPEISNQKESIRESNKELLAIVDEIPEVMVMGDMPEHRATYVLNRGQYDARGEEVTAGTPENVFTFSEDLPQNRLGLARWLFDEENPLTARVAVNRYWQMIFGKGIVSTSNDFGSQGSLPSHPELLDWLAVDFQESGWDVRNLLKQIVMSATYQQSSKLRKDLEQVDPQNIFLARSPSYRWPAEMVRDNALAASGLLVRDIGGKSVKPYQPDSLWIELGNFSHVLLYFHQDHGDDLYRRSMYTFIRRTSPPPYMTTFDVAPRSVCVMQREITNTPLQALNLMNDPQFVEAAKVLAERVMKESDNNQEDQIRQAFRLVTSREPNKEEFEVLNQIYEREVNRYSNQKSEAKELLSVGEYEIDKKLPNTQLAALTMVANTMLNLDEAYTKR
ncbi:MAG: DUF1553 domain-containing protein [Bacteroidota bacterium]